MAHPLVIILGPTASGKTKLAVALSQEFKGEVISADSRQVFRGMDIGTGKDLGEYKIDEVSISHHLIDIKEAGTTYNVNDFKNDFYRAFDDVVERKKLPILCGGTGMYINAILQNHELTAIPIDESLRVELLMLDKMQLQDKLNSYPAQLRSNADYSSMKRLVRAIEIAIYLSNHELQKINRDPINPIVIGLKSDLLAQRSRILDRLEQRLKNGLVEEVQTLLARGITKEILLFYGLEYKFIVAYLTGELDYTTLKERLGIAICQFAKRQMTFFRKMEKDGVQINWLDTDDNQLKEKAIELVNAKFL